MSGNIDDFDLYEVCEADEIDVTAGKNGEQTDDEQSRERGLSKRGAARRREINHKS